MNTENSPFNLNRLFDVEMDITVRFGLTELPLQEVVNFSNGSMIELNRTVDSPVELLVNDSLFAKGEVVVVDGYYSIKITELDLPNNVSNNPLKNNQNVKKEKEPVQNTAPPRSPETANQQAKPNEVPLKPTQTENTPKPQAPNTNPPKEEIKE